MAKEDRPTLRPTVVAIPSRRAPEARPAPPGRPPVTSPTGPTAIPGIARERLVATSADLRRLAPDVDRATVDRALGLIGGFVVEKASERRAILWGHDLQLDYAARAAEALDLAGAPVLERTRAYVTRMIEILSSLDPVAAVAREGGTFGGALRALGGRADTAGEIEKARAELDHLSRLMANALEELLTLKDRIERNASRLDALAGDAEAASVAALFLAEYLRVTRPDVAERLVERSMSLTQMMAQLREHRGLREAQVNEPLRLIGALQHVALVAMPSLLSSLAAFAGHRAGGRGPTPTEAGETTRRIYEIVQQLRA